MLDESKCQKRKCVHYLGVKNDAKENDFANPEVGERHVCVAFPDGIPNKIAFGNDLHTKPVKGDNGIQYERERREDTRQET